MENPFFPCKTKYSIPFPSFKAQIPAHISFNVSTLLVQYNKTSPSEVDPPPPPPPPSPSQTRNPGQRQLRRLCRDGKIKEAVSGLHSGSPITTRTYLSMLQTCIDFDSIETGRLLHSSLPSVKNPNPFVETKLISMYSKCGELGDARQVFDGMRHRNLFSWSAMIGGCGRENRWEEVVELFYRMMNEGVNPDAFLLPKILQACANIEDAATGKLLHSLTIRLGFMEESHVGNSILNLYAKCGELAMTHNFFKNLDVKDIVTWNTIISAHCQCGENDEALKLFEEMRNQGIKPNQVTFNILISRYNLCRKPMIALQLMKEMQKSKIAPDVFTWTSIISSLLQNKKVNQALDIFREMWTSGVKPNNMTVASVVSACTALKYLKNGKELHGYAMKNRGTVNLLVINSLVDLYAKCSRLEDAQRIFDSIANKDVFTWNSMIGGYMVAGFCGKAHELFLRMENLGLQRNVVTWNVMVSGYIQNREEDQAIEHFQKMEINGIGRNSASWNALISGFMQNGDANKALRVFRQMQLSSEKSNSITILSILPACANLISAWKVKEIHAYVLRSYLHHYLPIVNSLIDIYSKSGDLASAQVLFHTLDFKDLVSWNSMISGSVLHGNSHAAQELFNCMKIEGVKPSQSTYKSMIKAYSFDGLVNDGKDLFINIVEQQISPGLELYAAMVELFGRSGRLTEAYNMIKEMPFEPHSAVWNALLTAARYYGNVKLASLAAENLIRLEPKNPILQTMASRLHAMCSKSGEAFVMKSWKERNAHDFHSCCWVEDGHKVFTLYTDSKPMDESSSPILVESGRITKEIQMNVSSFRDARLDIEEEMEDDEELHCKRKAILFSLVEKPSFRVIRIIKNVRICTKCHGTAKLVSKFYGRDILIKDSKCLHHFRDGKCSCKDYW